MTIFPEWQRLRPWFVRQQINGKKDIQHANNLFPSFFWQFGNFSAKFVIVFFPKEIRSGLANKFTRRIKSFASFFSYGASSKNCG